MGLADAIYNSMNNSDNGGAPAPSAPNWLAQMAPQQPVYSQPAQQGGFDWNNFFNQQQQVQQANQQFASPFAQQQGGMWGQQNQNQFDQQNPMWQSSDSFQDENGRNWRKMSDVEKFFSGANQATEALSNYAGWDPNKGFTPENIVRFGLNLPGMMVSSIPDALATGFEIATGTPIKESDYESGYVPDEKLSTSQKAADIGYLGLDALGFVPGLGIEGKIGGTIAKGIGKAGGIGSKAIKEGADFAASGLTKSAGILENAAKAKGWEGNKLKAAAFGDTASDIAASAIFEGAQEAGQTGFEDVRYKRLGQTDDTGKDTVDRMVESAAWGSLGGLIPGATLAGANYGMSKIKSKNDAPITTQSEVKSWQPTTPDQWSLGTDTPSGLMTQSQQQYYLEQARNDSRLRSPGAIMVENVSADPSLLVDQMRMGSDDFAAAFYNGDKDALAVSRQICNTRSSGISDNVALAETRNAIENNTVNINGIDQQFNKRSDALGALRAKYWGSQEDVRDRRGFRSAWEKSPATKNRGGYLDVVDFFEGKGLIVHPYVAPLVGMDFDGDQSGLHVNTWTEDGGNSLNLIGYASEIMRNREGNPQSDIWYSDFRDGRYVKNAFRDKVREIFSPYKNGRSIADNFAKQMNTAVKSKNANYEVVRILDEIGDEVMRLRSDVANYEDADRFNKTPMKRFVVNNLMDYAGRNVMGQLDQRTQEIKGTFYADLAVDIIENDTTLSEDIKKQIFEDPRSPLYAKGRLGNDRRVGQHYEDLGLAYYTFVMEANQPFRQHAQLNLNFGKRQGAFSDLNDALNKFALDQDVLDILVRTSFRIAKATTTPLSAIEGMLDAHTFDVAYKESDLDRTKVSDGVGFDNLLENLRIAYNRDSVVYEEVKKSEKIGGYEEDIIVPRPEIQENDTNGIMRVFLRIFGNCKMEEVFNENTFPSMYKGYPISEVVSYFGQDPIKFNSIFTEANDLSLENKFIDLIHAYGSEKKMAGKGVRKLFEDVDLREVKYRMDQNGGKIAARDYAAVRNFVNNLVEVIGPSAADSFNLNDPIYFMENTKFGEMFLSGDKDTRVNAFYCLLTMGQFIDVQRVFRNDLNLKGEEYKRALDWANDQLEMFMTQSPLKREIAHEMLTSENHESNLLNGLSSINVSFEDKMNDLDTFLAPKHPDMDPIADFMIDGNDQFSVSAISRKKARAQQSITQYEKALFRESEDAVERLEKLVDTGDNIVDENVALAAIESAVHSANVSISTEPYVIAIADSLGTGLAWNEKGINPVSFSSIGEMQILQENGGALSYIDQLTSFSSGAMSDEDFVNNRKMVLSIFANRSQPIRIYGAGAKNRTAVITGDKVFAEVSPQYNPELGPTFRDWMALLKRIPQLEGMISENITQPMMVNGEGGAGWARLNSIDDMVKQYADIAQGAAVNQDDTRIIAQVDYGIRTVGSYLLNDREYVSALIHCMSDLGISENQSMSSIKSEFERLHNAFATTFFFDAQWRFHDRNGFVLPGRYEDMRSNYIGTIELNSIEHISTALANIQARIDEEGLRIEDENRNFEIVQRQMNIDNTKESVAQKVYNMAGLEAPEYESGDESYDDVYSSRMELRRRKIETRHQLAKLRLINNEFSNYQIDPVTGNRIVGSASMNVGITEDLVKSTIEDTISEIEATGVVIDEQTKQDIRDSARNMYLSERGRDLVAGDEEFIDIDMDIVYLEFNDLPKRISQSGESINLVLEKLNAIRHRIGDHTAFSDIDQLALENLYSKQGVLSDSKWNELIKRVDSSIMQYEIMKLNQEWQADLNKNAFMAQQQFIDTYRRIGDELDQILRDTPNPLKSDETMMFRNLDEIEDIWEREYSKSYERGFPVPDFTRSANQKAATDMSLGLSGGLVPGSIMRNGGALKKCSGLGYLSSEVDGFIEPRPMTLGQLRELYEQDGGDEVARWRYVKSGDWTSERGARGKSYQVGTLGHMLGDNTNFADDAVIQVFHPDDNPNGIWFTNTSASMSEKMRPSLRFANIIGTILDTSQEAMVLKLKKRFEAKIKIADTYGFNTHYDALDLSQADFVNNTEGAMLRLRNMLLNYREGYIAEFERAFNDELSDLNYGREQARILAQGLTPGVIVSVGNQEHVISAEYLWDLNRFTERLSQLTEDGSMPSIGYCQVLSVSPTEASTRINYEIARYNAEITPGAKPVIEESRRRATNAFTNWDDYLDNQLSIDEIFGMMSPLGRGRNGGIATEESLTYVQRYLGLIHEQNLGARVGYVAKSGKPLNKDSNYNLWQASKVYTDEVLPDVNDYQIIKLFGASDERSLAELERDQYHVQILSSADDYYWPNLDRTGCALVQDSGSLDAAIKYAQRTGNHLLITNDVFYSLTPDAKRAYQAKNKPVKSNLGMLYDLNPAAVTYDKAWDSSDRGSGLTPLATSDIRGTFIDGVVTNLYNMGDADIWADPEMTEYLNKSGMSKLNANTISGAKGRTDVLSRKEAESALNILFDDAGNPQSPEVWNAAGYNFNAKAYEDYDFKVIANKIYEYFQAYKDGKVDADGVWRSGAGRGSCITMIKVTNLDGSSIIAPIIAPKNTPESWDHCYFSNDKMGNIYLGYASHLQVAGDDSNLWFFKMSLENEAFKGIVSPIPEKYELPTYGFGDGREKISMAATNDTEKSRVPGRPLQIFQGSLWYFSKKIGGSWLRNNDGTVKSHIVDQYTSDETGVIDIAGLNELLNGDKRQWDRVKNGQISLVPADDNNFDAKNEMIKGIIGAVYGKVPIVDLFSHIKADGTNTETDVRYYMALKDLSLNETLMFFNGMDPTLCPNGCWDNTDERAFWFNQDGLFRCSYRGKMFFAPVRWAPHNPIADFSEVEGVGGPANESNQSLVRMGLEQGFLDKDLQMMMDFSSYLAGNPSFYHQRIMDKLETYRRNSRVNATQESRYLSDMMNMKYGTPKEIQQMIDVGRVGEMYSPSHRRKFYDNGENIDNPYTDQRVRAAMFQLNQVTDKNLSPRTVECLTMAYTGHTYNDGKGINRISLQNYADAIRTIADSIRTEGLAILSNQTVNGNRISQPLLTPDLARIIWDNSSELRNHSKNLDENGNPSFEIFKQRMFDEQDRSSEIVDSLPPRETSKKIELWKASEWLNLQWGRSDGHRLYENSYSTDLINSTSWITESLRQAGLGEDFDLDKVKELSERTQQQILDRKKLADGLNHARRVEAVDPAGRDIIAYKNDRARPLGTIFRGLTDISRMMGVLDIFLPISNIGFRGVSQTTMDWIMAAGRHGHGPYKVAQSIDQKILRGVAANDQMGFDLWMVMHDAALTNDELELMVSFETDEDLRNWIDTKANESKFNKWKNMAFRFASGGNWLMKQQYVNFFNRFVCFASEDPTLSAYWLTPDANGYTRMDRMLAEPNGAGMFLKEVFGGRDGTGMSYQAAMNAMQSVRAADMAQDHIAIEMFKNITNKHPIPEFLLTTLVSRFPRYGLNFTEEILNYVMPMSSIRYVMTDFIAQRAHEKAESVDGYVDPHYELLQRNTSLKEAFLVDMMHLGPHLVAMLIAAIPGACEPPDDEKKWGNPQEWIICGHRVGEAWWMEDILGIALPMICYQKSVELGKPRLDLITSGITSVCYANPMLKIGDAVSFMMDPFDGLYADYEEMRAKYDATDGGQFGILDFIQDNATTFGYSYAAQFFTPTFVKSAWNMIMPYEADYRHAYKENARGVLTDDGEAGNKLVEVDYDDAMLRRLTRKNPVLALAIDLTHPGNTSYSPLGFPGKMAMPLTVYNDQHQYNYMKQWSINGLSESDAQAKVLQILATLEQYQDNLDELIATGFYLDSGTKAAVSSAIWDQYYGIEEYWNQMQANGELDFYYLGYGDYETGRSTYYQLKQIKDDAKRYYNDLYYKTMKSKQLTQPMYTYNRYNTTYAQDDDGNWYATGFHPQGLLPFTSAPGTLTDPEGTAGYANDWVSISQVDGMPLENMRALVPTNANDYEEWPDLKSWSADENGEGHSALYQQWNNGSSANTVVNSTSSGYPSSNGARSSSYPRSYGSGGGYRSGGGGSGGYRSGGGSGSGSRRYTPNMSAPSVSAPTSAASLPRTSFQKSNPSRIMNTDRLIEADELYLRPDFETKGSREAYKRSDI